MVENRLPRTLVRYSGEAAVLGAPVLISHAGDLLAFRRQQRTCRKTSRAAELRLNGLAQVLHEMKTVGDLPRLRRAFLRALGERTAAIPTDDLDARMPLEPAHSHACVTFREKMSTSRRSKSTTMVP